MEDIVQIHEFKEEFHAVMEDIKPENIGELATMGHSSAPPLLILEKYIKEEKGAEISQEIVTVTDDEDLDEIEVLEVIDDSDIDPPVLSPNYEDVRHQQSYDIHRRGMLSLCRLCATRSNGMIHMFDPTEQHRNIIQKIEYCLPIVVNKNDNLSKAACQLCLAKLELSYQFYKTVTEAEKLLTMRDKTWKILKEEPITEEKDVLLGDLNDLVKCRTSSFSSEHQDADSSSNVLDSSTNEVPLTNATTSQNVISSNLNDVREERTRSSNAKRRRTDPASNSLILTTKQAVITDADVENNIISSNGNNIMGKDIVKSSSDTHLERELSSNALNSTTDETPITDRNVKEKNTSLMFKDTDNDRTQISSNEYWQTDPSSNTLNSSRTTLEFDRATSNSVLNDPMCPINSDEEFRPDVERCDSDSFSLPVSRCHEASDDSRNNGVSEHHEQPSCNVSEEQLSTFTEVNTRETEHQQQPHEEDPTVGIYRCKYFDEQCEGETNLLDHMRIDIYEYPFTCSVCDKAFKTKRHRNYHIVTHTRAESFSCNTCKASFATRHALRSHQRTIHQRIKNGGSGHRPSNEHRTSDLYSNSLNGRSKGADITDATVQNNVISSNLNNFGEDSTNDEGQNTNSSSIDSNCRTTEAHMTDTTVRNNVISSNLKTLGKNSLNDECQKTISSPSVVTLSTTISRLKKVISNSVLNRPLSPEHSDRELGSDEEFECPQIGTSHQAFGDRRKDEESKQNVKPSCNVPEEQFRTGGQEEGVNTHAKRCKRSKVIQQKSKKTIETSLKYRCADCGKRSRTKRLILDHISYYHGNESLFKCSTCDRRFRRRDQRDRHMITHSEERTFECNMCGTRFRWRGTLARHKALHSRWDLTRSIQIK